MSSLEACRGLMGPPQRAPKTRSHGSPLAGARSLCETTCARPAASAPSHVKKVEAAAHTALLSRPSARGAGQWLHGDGAAGPRAFRPDPKTRLLCFMQARWRWRATAPGWSRS